MKRFLRFLGLWPNTDTGDYRWWTLGWWWGYESRNHELWCVKFGPVTFVRYLWRSRDETWHRGWERPPCDEWRISLTILGGAEWWIW